jgi:hypothetical protein
MADPITKFGAFDGAFQEAYNIERRVELVGSDGFRYRLDVFEVVGAETKTFLVRCYVERAATIGGGQTEPLWLVEERMAGVTRPTADEALASGMSFLAKVIKGI